jgi:allantoinase
MNAAVVEDYPALAEAIGQAGWEVVGHGYRQRSLGADDEEAVVAESLAVLEHYYGRRPRGWLGPGLQESEHTPELLVRQGVEYVFDWVVDDLPCWMQTEEGPLLSVPYTLELNDSVLFAVNRQQAAELSRRVADTLAALETELMLGPRVLTLGLHPHLIGVPHRIGHLADIIGSLRSRHDAVFVTGGPIHDWYVAAGPPPDGRL